MKAAVAAAAFRIRATASSGLAQQEAGLRRVYDEALLMLPPAVTYR